MDDPLPQVFFGGDNVIFFKPMSLAIIDSNTYEYLDFKHPSFIKEYSPGTTTGKPKYYSLFEKM